MRKKIAVTLMVLALLFGAAGHAHATESLDLERKCSLTLTMQWEGEKLSGGSLTICRVGQAVFADGAWTFLPIPELEESGVSLDHLNDTQLPNQLRQLAQEKQIPAHSSPIQDGKAVFPDLTAGLYLVTQEDAGEGFSPISPFLISLPRWENEAYVYDLVAQPKVAPEPLPTEPSQPTEPTEPTEPPGPELPQTGMLNWPVPVMAAAGLTLFALGWYLRYGKKMRHER